MQAWHDPPVNEPAEFPVPPDTGAYYLGAFGFAMMVFAAAGIVSMFFGMARPYAFTADEMMAIDGTIAGLATVWWIRRWYRVNHERKLVIGEEGIVYVRFADRRRVMRWDDIERVTERTVLTDEGDCSVLELELRRGRFRIREGDFVGYWQLRKLIDKRLPSKTTLLNSP